MTDNAFARAAAGAGSNATPTDTLTGNREGYDPLFGGGQSRPSLFTKEHGIGVERIGVISDVPFEKHSRFMDEDETGKPIMGALKYWDRTVQPNAPTPKTHDPSGKANDPVYDTVIPLSTEYRDKGADDTGDRAWYVAGAPSLKAVREAIQGAGLTSREQMKGMTLKVQRSGKSGRAWLYQATLTR